MFPLELTAEPEEADIRFNWETGTASRTHAGEEMDWVQFRRVGNELTGRQVAYISVDLSRQWSKDEMRAIVLHEMGHALGIRGQANPRENHVLKFRRRPTKSTFPALSIRCLEVAGQQTQPAGSQYPDSAL